MKKIFALILFLCLAVSFPVMAEDTLLDKSGFTATATTVWRDSNAAQWAIDGNMDTTWHSHPDDKDKFPVTFDVDFGKVEAVSGIHYHARVDGEGSINGVWSNFDVEISADGKTYQKAVTGLSVQSVKEVQIVPFGKTVQSRYMRFTINEGSKGYATCKELEFVAGSAENAETPSGTATSPKTEAASPSSVLKTGWKILSSSSLSGKGADKIIDGNVATYWHSNYYTTDNKTIDGKDDAPYYITIILPSETVISGFTYLPRQDKNDAGKVKAYEVYASDKDSGAAVKIYEGTFSVGAEELTADFGFDVKVKSLVFVVKEGVSGYGTIAEMGLLSAKGTSAKNIADVKIGTSEIMVGKGADYAGEETEEAGIYYTDKSSWKIEASSQRMPHYPVTKAFDGNVATYWHSDFTDDGGPTVTSMVKGPHTLDITFPDLRTISGFIYTPRDGNKAGIITGYELYLSETDDGEWIKVDEGTFKDDVSVKYVYLSQNVKAKKLRFKSVTSVSDYGVCAEFDVMTETAELTTAESVAGFASYNKENKLVKIPETSVTSVDASSIWNESNGTNFVFDGVASRAWHSDPADKGKFPITLYIELDNVYEIPALDYYARVDGEGSINGVWTKFNIWISEDGVDYTLAEENLSFESIKDVQRISFSTPLKGKFIEFEIIEGSKGYATCGELILYEKMSDGEKRKSGNYYNLVIGSNKIVSAKDGAEKETVIDVAPFIDDGRTMIPLRGLLEEMDAAITWDGTKRKIGITTDKVTIELQIMNDLCYVTDSKYGRVRYTLDVPPVIRDGRTFIPVRFVTEQLGYNVTWESDTQTVKITE